MLGLSISDCVFSFSSWFLSQWPIPSDNVHDNIYWGNVGNQATCQAQGFMTQLGGFSSGSYSCMLSIYYLLQIKYKWSETKLQKAEPYFHGGIWGLSLIAAIVPLFKDVYNQEILFCHIQSYPIWCDAIEGFECIRGNDVFILKLILFVIPSGIYLLTITFCMGSIIAHVAKQERAIMRISISEGRGERNKSTKKVAKRALKYVAAYLSTWVPFIMTFIALKRSQKNVKQRSD